MMTITTKTMSEIKLTPVGVYKPDSLELQPYAPEIWDADSWIHVYDTHEYQFVFIEELGKSSHERAGEFHVLVGNFSELYDTLEDALDSLQYALRPCDPMDSKFDEVPF
tara:strand:+ start:4459 stop:4785 length:327 start_codon:yes stop_codon:yes gene_type:complete